MAAGRLESWHTPEASEVQGPLALLRSHRPPIRGRERTRKRKASNSDDRSSVFGKKETILMNPRPLRMNSLNNRPQSIASRVLSALLLVFGGIALIRLGFNVSQITYSRMLQPRAAQSHVIATNAANSPALATAMQSEPRGRQETKAEGVKPPEQRQNEQEMRRCRAARAAQICSHR